MSERGVKLGLVMDAVDTGEYDGLYNGEKEAVYITIDLVRNYNRQCSAYPQRGGTCTRSRGGREIALDPCTVLLPEVFDIRFDKFLSSDLKSYLRRSRQEDHHQLMQGLSDTTDSVG